MVTTAAMQDSRIIRIFCVSLFLLGFIRHGAANVLAGGFHAKCPAYWYTLVGSTPITLRVINLLGRKGNSGGIILYSEKQIINSLVPKAYLPSKSKLEFKESVTWFGQPKICKNLGLCRPICDVLHDLVGTTCII